MSDLITPGIPDIGPISASNEIANTWGTGDSLDRQVSTFARNNPEAAEEAAKAGMDLETYYLYEILGLNPGSSQQNFFQKVGSEITNVAKNKVGNVVDIGKEAFSAGKNVAKGKPKAALNNAGNLADKVIELPSFGTSEDGPVGKPVHQKVADAFNTEALTSGALNFGKNIVGSASSMGGGVVGKIADADEATVMDSGAAVGILRDDITGEGTFLGGANTLMADDERINYDTSTSGSNQGSSGMDSRLEGYYNILREQGPEAAAIYAENLGLFVEGVGSALFGAARQYTDEQLMSYGRSVGINDGSVPTIQEITQAGVVLDPSEERRVMDSLMGSQVAGGRQFDPAVAQSAIDMNQMMYNRRQPFITAGINASNIAPGIQFGGGIAATMEGALPSFSDIFKMDQADIQNKFNQQLLASQESASDINKILGTVNAVSGAYESNLFGFKDLIDTTKENLGIGQKKENQFVMQDDTLEDLYKKYITGGG
jgi:hypothetical protein